MYDGKSEKSISSKVRTVMYSISMTFSLLSQLRSAWAALKLEEVTFPAFALPLVPRFMFNLTGLTKE
jgi:hypothetical protein